MIADRSWDLLTSPQQRAAEASLVWFGGGEVAKAIAWFDTLEPEHADMIRALLEEAWRGRVTMARDAKEAAEGKFDGWYNPERVTDTSLRYAVQGDFGEIEAAFMLREDAEKYAKKRGLDAKRIKSHARKDGETFELVGLRA